MIPEASPAVSSRMLLSATYLARLADPARRHRDGIAAFTITLVLALAVLALQLAR